MSIITVQVYFCFVNFCFIALSTSKTFDFGSDRNSNALDSTLCSDCEQPSAIKAHIVEFKWQSKNFCQNIAFQNYTHLWFCHICHNEDTFLLHREKNLDDFCSKILKRFFSNTKHVKKGKVVKSLQSVPSTNNRRITKTPSHIRRKLLMHKNGNESNYSRFYSTIQKNQQGHFEWEPSFQNVVLQCLILVVMMFTFFAIIIAMMWLCSMYVLKRLKRQKRSLQPNLCYDITEF